MTVKGLNHLLFSVSNLKKSITFYKNVFDAKLLVEGKTTAYFDLNGIWLALNEEKEIPRTEIHKSYTHIAFTIEEAEYDQMYRKLKNLNVNILTGRPRDEQDKKSIYFTDPDGHKFEFHTGTLQDRLDYYKKTKHICSFIFKKIIYISNKSAIPFNNECAPKYTILLVFSYRGSFVSVSLHEKLYELKLVRLYSFPFQ